MRSLLSSIIAWFKALLRPRPYISPGRWFAITNVSDAVVVPDGIHCLSLQNCHTKEAPKLPPHLMFLDLVNCSFGTPLVFPTELRFLRMQHCTLALPTRADNLRYLLLMNTDHTHIPCYKNLLDLELHDCDKIELISSNPFLSITVTSTHVQIGNKNIMPMRFEHPIRPRGKIHVHDLQEINSLFSYFQYPHEMLMSPEYQAVLDTLNECYVLDYRTRAKRGIKPFKEELMQRCWHPDRVARWVDQGIDEMMMGL